jgi:hypothetical protein
MWSSGRESSCEFVRKYLEKRASGKRVATSPILRANVSLLILDCEKVPSLRLISSSVAPSKIESTCLSPHRIWAIAQCGGLSEKARHPRLLLRLWLHHPHQSSTP